MNTYGEHIKGKVVMAIKNLYGWETIYVLYPNGKVEVANSRSGDFFKSAWDAENNPDEYVDLLAHMGEFEFIASWYP